MDLLLGVEALPSLSRRGSSQPWRDDDGRRRESGSDIYAPDFGHASINLMAEKPGAEVIAELLHSSQLDE